MHNSIFKDLLYLHINDRSGHFSVYLKINSCRLDLIFPIKILNNDILILIRENFLMETSKEPSLHS